MPSSTPRPETHRMCDHGGCQSEATLTLTAIYSVDDIATHPTWASYPMPMFRACRNHLAVLAERDAGAPGSTMSWLVRLL